MYVHRCPYRGQAFSRGGKRPALRAERVATPKSVGGSHDDSNTTAHQRNNSQEMKNALWRISRPFTEAFRQGIGLKAPLQGYTSICSPTFTYVSQLSDVSAVLCVDNPIVTLLAINQTLMN